MIKSWEEFEKENYIIAKMEELIDLISNFCDGHNISYNWRKDTGEKLLVSFRFDDLLLNYNLDMINFHITREKNGVIDLDDDLSSNEEGIDIIEKDVHDVLGVTESYTVVKYSDIFILNENKKKEEPKAERTKSGRKVPGKYLTKNKKAMKKEIEKYQGSSEYKKDWDADYESGQGGQGKRYKTKKSDATKAYQKMFKDKK